MLAISYKNRFTVALLCALLLLLGSCKKNGTGTNSTEPGTTLEILFAENVLNKNFIVNLATDTANDLTSQYNGYTFVLTKTTSYYNGPMTGTKGTTTITGTWSSNADYSQLNISLTNPAAPPEFIFINRSWRFTRKAFPIMELAPWGTTDPKVLHMQRL